MSEPDPDLIDLNDELLIDPDAYPEIYPPFDDPDEEDDEWGL